ncbi:hypothetical protein AN958_02137 [Leucoagaricus sp. SymC.cos]|nr:hypothetical protein AN958_02137 [Leucoagaricus sp. SymC.cos]
MSEKQQDQQQQEALIDPDAVDLATSSTSCRILVVSPSPVQATTLIRRVQALGKSTDAQTEEIAATRAGGRKKDLLSSDLVKIPWTIENKYYSADVHFAVHPMRGLAPYLLQNIPALIFVWASNEAYQHHLERISRDLAGHEPEVSLAVRVKASPDEAPEEPINEESEEDNASIDEVVSRFGFEYVDATVDITNRREERKYEEEDESDGIPNLPRVLDALSTIMWPSMKGRDKGLKHGKGQTQRDPTLAGWGSDDGLDRSLSLVNDLVANSSSQLSAQAGRMETEMEELTRWLENDVRNGDREDPWKMAVRSDTKVSSPTEDKFLPSASLREKYQEQTGSSEPPNFAKFDDDFTVFVSAPPAEEPERDSGRSTPILDGDEEQDGLRPPGELRTYNSLGSVSDFGESDEGKETARVISDDDEELPTRDEIFETSSRIFGKGGKVSSTGDSQDSQRSGNRGRTGDGETQPDGDDEYDIAPFDLSKVLDALQQMKEEISGMENEDERRKAAARVALGLVYGLETEGDF